MPALVECESCGLHLLGFESRGPEPISYDECPECSCSEFTFVE